MMEPSSQILEDLLPSLYHSFELFVLNSTDAIHWRWSPWSVLSEYLSAQSQPNEAPFSLPGWPLMRAAHSTCSNFQWTLTLALCLSLAVSTFLGFWGSRDMLGPSFSHPYLLHFLLLLFFLWQCQGCCKPPSSVLTSFPANKAVFALP